MARSKSTPVSSTKARMLAYNKKNMGARAAAMNVFRAKTFVSAVHRAVNRFAEKKFAIASANNLAIATLNAALITPTQIYLLPQIAQGSTQGTRIGNKISPVKCTLKIMFNVLPFNATTNPSTYPVNLKYWIIKDKRSVQRNAITATDMVGFFQNGSTDSNFTALPVDCLLDVNRDQWTVYKQDMRLMDFSNTLNAGLAANAFPTNDAQFQWSCDLDLTKYIKKTLIYDDVISNVPTNDNLFIIFTACSSDGSSSAALTMAECHYAYQMQFVDV